MSEEQNNFNNRRKMLSVFLLLFLAGGGLLLFGFIRTQGVEGDYWRERSKERIVSNMRDPAHRGNIYSADGKTLATTVVVCDLYLDLGHRQVCDRDGKPVFAVYNDGEYDYTGYRNQQIESDAFAYAKQAILLYKDYLN